MPPKYTDLQNSLQLPVGSTGMSSIKKTCVSIWITFSS